MAVNLPAEDVAVDASGYARVVAAAAAKLGPQPSMIVGRSLAGITIPLVPALTPVSRVVFLAALIPWPGEAIADVIQKEEALGAVDRHRARRARTLVLEVGRRRHRGSLPRLRPQARTLQAQRCPPRARDSCTEQA